MNIKEIRQKYPQYNDMSDVEFADAFHGKYYSDIPKEDFYKTLGVSVKPKTSLLENPVTGVAETALSFITGGLAQPIAGLAGLAAGGSADTVDEVMSALTYKPRGETGKKYAEKTGEILSLPIEYAGKGAYALTGSEAARSIAEAGTEIGMNFLPLGAGKKGLKRKPKVDVPARDLNAVAADLEPPKAPIIPEQLELPLETAPQSIREMQTKGSPQMDLFEIANQPHERMPTRPDEVEPPAPRYGEQPELDFGPIEQDTSTYRADQYGGGKGYGVLDENGVPIRADLSMEAANLENPLQRNLWGDELGPALDQQRSLTEAIDRMQETGRTAQGKFMPKEFLSDTFGRELDTPVPKDMAREGPFSVERDPTATRPGQYMRSQQGAIDPRIFEDLYNFGKSVVRSAEGVLMPLYHGSTNEIKGDIKASREGGALGNGVYLAVRPEYASGYAEGTGGNVHQVYANIRNPLKIDGPGDPMVRALETLGMSRDKAINLVEKAYDKKGYITTEVQNLARKQGYDGIFQYRNGKLSEIVAFDKEQVKNAISPEAVKSQKQPKSTRTMTEDEITGGWEEDIPSAPPSYNRFGQGGGQTILNDIAGLAIDGFNKIKSLTSKSPEVVTAKEQLAKDAKQQRVQAIINGKDFGYLENVTTPEAVIAAADGAKDISAMSAAGGKTVSPGINHLAIKTNNPLVKYMRAMTRKIFVEADRLTEQYITGQDGIGKVVQKLTPSEKVEVVQLLQLGDKKQQRITPEVMKKHGFSEAQIDFVERYYEMDQVKLDTWNKSRAEAGLPPVTAREGHVPGIFKGDYKQLVLSPDGKPLGVIAVDFKWQLEAARKKMQEKFPDAKFSPMRRSNLGGSGSARSGEFGAMQEVLTMLAEKDPAFKEVQDLIANAIAENSDKAYGAAQHALRKKGIVGNEGNKPWLDPERNANDFIKAYLSHWEDQMISHLALPVEKNVRALMDNPALDGMPKAKEYVDSYLKNMGGRGVGDFGRALNTLLDTPAKIVGAGPSSTREAVSQFNKRMGQYSMGFGNMLFSITQWLQVAQTGMPELTAAAKQLGVPQIKVIPAMTRAMIDMLSNTVKDPSPELKATLDEAKARGLMTFSEFSDVSKISQGKASAMFDKVADFNRAELGEKPTRPLVFRAAVLMLKDSGLEGKALYDAAYNITQAGMFDYRMNERPMMYQKLGVTGQLAGGLQTFKHAYLGQLNRLGANGLKDPVSAMLAAGALVAYSGIMGLPFYSELDQLFQAITNKVGKRTTIAEYAMQELPRWAKYGIISDATNINMQSRLSSADVLPNSPIEALTPWASTVGRVGQAVGDVASFNDKLAWGNLGTQLAPQGPLKGMAEKAFSTDDEGYVLNREGLRGNVRTDWDKGVRTFTGGRSLDEAITGENQYQSGQRLKGYRDKQKSIMEEIKREYVQGTLTKDRMSEYSKKYVESKGDPSRLVRDLVSFAQTAKLDKQRRLQGIPNESLSSLYKFQEYSDDVSK